MTTTTSASTARSPPSDLQVQIEEELRAEDQEVLFPLLDRLTSSAEMVSDGKPVDAEYLGEGLRLWERYATELHGDRVQMLSRVFTAVPQPKSTSPPPKPHRLLGRGHPKSSPEAHAETVVEMFSHILADQTRMAERHGAFDSLLRDYAKSQYWAREMLASLIRSSAFSDRSWALYEQDFVREHFDAQQSADAGAVVGQELPALRAHRGRLAADVRAYLQKPVAVLPPPTSGSTAGNRTGDRSAPASPA